jgi:periplasmic divalent cation tolerance protein
MYSVILTTAKNRDEAKKLAEAIIKNRKAACVQLLPIESYYFWEGGVNNDPEVLLLVKTKSELFSDVERVILENHSYKLPEIIQLEISDGLSGYLQWISDETRA